jgi:hypothetical protein
VSPVTGAIVQQAMALQEDSTREMPGTSFATVLLQPGLIGGLDANNVFGTNGTSRLPGSADTLDAALSTPREVEEKNLPAACAAGNGDGSACEAAKSSNLPYPTNRVLSSVMRFFRP